MIIRLQTLENNIHCKPGGFNKDLWQKLFNVIKHVLNIAIWNTKYFIINIKYGQITSQIPLTEI